LPRVSHRPLRTDPSPTAAGGTPAGIPGAAEPARRFRSRRGAPAQPPHELLLDELAVAPDRPEEAAVSVAGLKRHLDVDRDPEDQRAVGEAMAPQRPREVKYAPYAFMFGHGVDNLNRCLDDYQR
jgi:hypothetical protein